MNVLLLTYQGDIAGSTLSITYLARGLAQRGHNVYVGCRKESLIATYFDGYAVNVIPMKFRSKWDLKNARHIADVCREYSIDIINAQSSLDRYTSMIACKFMGAKAKLVFTRRQVSRSLGGPQSWLYQWGTDKIVAVSEGIRESIRNDGIPDEHIAVIRNGTPAEKYANPDEIKSRELYEQFELKEGDFVLGCISRLKEQKQIIEALAISEEKVTAIFVGISEIPGADIAAAEAKGHRIIFAGRVPAKDVIPFYALFDVKVLASTMEGLSQSLLEAMYLRVPVIATAAAGNLDLVKNGENGLLFQDGDISGLASSIHHVRFDPALRGKLIDQAFVTASVDFSIERTLDGYEALFDRLVSA